MAEGEFALARQHLDQAVHVTNDPVRWGSAVTDLDFHIAYADGAAQAGDLQALENHVGPAERDAERLGHRLYQAVALRARGVQALFREQPAEAVAFHSRALTIFETMGTAYQIGRTLSERARAHQRTGDLDSARADIRRAISAFDGLGARPAAQRARQLLDSIGIDPPSA